MRIGSDLTLASDLVLFLIMAFTGTTFFFLVGQVLELSVMSARNFVKAFFSWTCRLTC
jgi:hypothetical protein